MYTRPCRNSVTSSAASCAGSERGALGGKRHQRPFFFVFLASERVSCLSNWRYVAGVCLGRLPPARPPSGEEEFPQRSLHNFLRGSQFCIRVTFFFLFGVAERCLVVETGPRCRSPSGLTRVFVCCCCCCRPRGGALVGTVLLVSMAFGNFGAVGPVCVVQWVGFDGQTGRVVRPCSAPSREMG